MSIHIGEIGASWIASTGPAASLKLNGTGSVYLDTSMSTLTTVTASGLPQTPDYSVEADLIFGSATTDLAFIVLVRDSDPVNAYGYRVRCSISAGPLFKAELFADTSSGSTSLGFGTYFISLNTAVTVKVELLGINLQVLVNNRILIATTNSTFANAGTVSFGLSGTDVTTATLLVSRIQGLPITALTQGPFAPQPPTGVSASDGVSTTQISVSWVAPVGASSYTVYRSTVSGVPGTVIASPTANSYIDTTGVVGTTYYYSVSATGVGGTSALSSQDSGYLEVPPPPPVYAGTLLGSVQASSTTVNLTTEGTSDWAKWPSYIHKTGGNTQISNYAAVGSSTVSSYTNDPRQITWSGDGTPTASGSDTSGIYITGTGTGFRVSAPADTTSRILKVYVGGWSSGGTLTASLSDGSALQYSNSSISGSGQYDGAYTLTYAAAAASQQIVVTWVQASGSGNVTLQAVTLSGGSVAAVPPSPPTNITATDGTLPSSVSVSWSPSTNATSYTVYRSTTSGVTGIALATVASTSYSDSTAQAGTTYYYSVSATGVGGTSAVSVQNSGYIAVSTNPVWVNQTQIYIDFTRGVSGSHNALTYVSDPLGLPLTLTRQNPSLVLPTGVTFSAPNYVYSGTDPGAPVTVTGEYLIADNAVPTSGTIVTLQLLSPVGGTSLPFSFGQAFKRGAVVSGNTVTSNLAAFQWTTKATWDDGSVKHGVMAGHVDLTANVSFTLELRSSASGGGGTLVSEADLITALTGAVVTLNYGAYGTSNLIPLLGVAASYNGTSWTWGRFRQWISGVEMSEFHYVVRPSSDSQMITWFYVQCYKTGKVEIEVVAENFLFKSLTSPGTRSYIPTLTIGGTVRYNNSGATLNHYYGARWSQRGWLNTAHNPQITPKHDTVYLMDSKLFPNYAYRNPTSAAFTQNFAGVAPQQSNVPMGRGNHSTDMQDTGGQDDIGLLPSYEALFLSSNGNSVMYNCTVANAYMLGSYQMHFRDEATLLCPLPSAYPNAWTDVGGNPLINRGPSGPLHHEFGHAPSLGYLAYVLTGRFYFADEMVLPVVYMHVSSNYVFRGNEKGHWIGMVRTRAWTGCRSTGQAVAILPDADTLKGELRTIFANNMVNMKGLLVTGTLGSGLWKNDIGCVGLYSGYGASSSPYETGSGKWVDSPWMQHYFIQSLGYTSDLGLGLDATSAQAHTDVRNFSYRHCIGLLGDGVTSHCWRMAMTYTCFYGQDENQPPNVWYPNWITIYNDMKVFYAYTLTTCNNSDTMLGSSGGAPAAMVQGYWGYLLPAISLAVEHSGVGQLGETARTSFDRLYLASNFSPNAVGFNNKPTFGVLPRNL